NITSDINNVFGLGSPEQMEAASNPIQAQADFMGIAIHCAQNSRLCTSSAHAKPDVLNDEPGGYSGFLALFGNKYVAPAINSGIGFVLDLDGNHVTDRFGNDGFPNNTLPAVSFVRPFEALAAHPADSTSSLYEQFLRQLIASVKANPSIWKSTAIFITTDE